MCGGRSAQDVCAGRQQRKKGTHTLEWGHSPQADCDTPHTRSRDCMRLLADVQKGRGAETGERQPRGPLRLDRSRTQGEDRCQESPAHPVTFHSQVNACPDFTVEQAVFRELDGIDLPNPFNGAVRNYTRYYLLHRRENAGTERPRNLPSATRPPGGRARIRPVGQVPSRASAHDGAP